MYLTICTVGILTAVCTVVTTLWLIPTLKNPSTSHRTGTVLLSTGAPEKETQENSEWKRYPRGKKEQFFQKFHTFQFSTFLSGKPTSLAVNQTWEVGETRTRKYSIYCWVNGICILGRNKPSTYVAGGRSIEKFFSLFPFIRLSAPDLENPLGEGYTWYLASTTIIESRHWVKSSQTDEELLGRNIGTRLMLSRLPPLSAVVEWEY